MKYESGRYPEKHLNSVLTKALIFKLVSSFKLIR